MKTKHETIDAIMTKHETIDAIMTIVYDSNKKLVVSTKDIKAIEDSRSGCQCGAPS